VTKNFSVSGNVIAKVKWKNMGIKYKFFNTRPPLESIDPAGVMSL